MDDIAELVDAMRKNPKDVRYADACKVADHCFGKPRQQGSSHRVWKMPWAGDPRVNLQQGDGGKAKRYQVQQLLECVDKLAAHVARAAQEKAEAAEGGPIRQKKGQHK